MSGQNKIRTNDPCPCGSGKKYKKCCYGSVLWDNLRFASFDERVRKLSIRGKNIHFINCIGEALQVDANKPISNFAALKKAFTPVAVKRIYEAIPKIWPDYDDYHRCLSQEKEEVTALFTGNYEPDAVFRALTRHAIYSDRILLVDPFIHPKLIRDEYNPLLHPEKHRTNTVKYSYLWLLLAPWIMTGIVKFIRAPGDFDPRVHHEILEIQREKFESHPELRKMAKQEIQNVARNFGHFGNTLEEYRFLLHTDEQLLELYRKCPPEQPGENEAEYLKFIHERRDMHPYYVDPIPGQSSELLYLSTGACYETAKRICAISNSHIVTDISLRWKELEFDHTFAKSSETTWAPFAKALQNADLKVLNNITLQAAFRLREEDRLESMRHFFNKVWRAAREPDLFSEANAKNLAAELDEHVKEAEYEWRKIDSELLKWFGITSGLLITSGIADFVPAAASSIIAGATGLARAQWQRRSFKNRFPAGFFLNVKH